jgi:hypothetical protein
MNPLRRELLNGLFVLVLSTLLSTAIAAFQIKFNLQVWLLILVAAAVVLGGYVVFEFVLSSERRETEGLRKTEQRELEWLKRVGNPARLELGTAPIALVIDSLRTMRPGTDYTVMLYFDREGGSSRPRNPGREPIYRTILEQLSRGTIREYKRLVCFDRDVLASAPELKSGVLRVGEGPGTIDRSLGEHCRVMLETKGCSLYVAPVVLRNNTLSLYGEGKANMSVDTVDQETGSSELAGGMFFFDPPNGEIIEQFRQIERATERRMVAVHTIRFPEDEAPTASLATRSPTAR